MEKSKRTKQETIKYFRQLAWEFEKQGIRDKDEKALASAEAWELAAFEIERNME